MNNKITRGEHQSNLIELGERFDYFSKKPDEELVSLARSANSWFIPEFISAAASSLAEMLNAKDLAAWISRYPEPSTQKTVGIVLAGNIPWVGLHDLICILASGHKAAVKLSSQDRLLMEWAIKQLIEIDDQYAGQISQVDNLKNVDAVIATGSSNSSRYFEYYFREKPKIIRQNRTSLAVLSGEESRDELELLADDIFMYFGLGCRNVAKVFLPSVDMLPDLQAAFEKYSYLIDFNPYFNNYIYHKAILAMNLDRFVEAQHYLMLETEKIHSPVGLIYYQVYSELSEVQEIITSNRESIQCVVSHLSALSPDSSFGMAQKPAIMDYADNIDTMQFLSGL